MAKALMTFSAHEFDTYSEYYVEELRSNGRWRRIPEDAGPYSSSDTAGEVARQYSRDHHVKTRVVGYQ